MQHVLSLCILLISSAGLRDSPSSSIYRTSLLPSYSTTPNYRPATTRRHHWLPRRTIWKVPARLVSHAKHVLTDQTRYGLLSTFFRSVPPPTVHIHLHLYSNLSSPDSEIPSLISKPLKTPSDFKKDSVPPTDTGLASVEEAKAFELWLRGIWMEKEKRMEGFFKNGRFESGEGGVNAREVVPIRQT